eukprot:scaffold282114_cov24-Attheya_sp.AAC.1
MSSYYRYCYCYHSYTSAGGHEKRCTYNGPIPSTRDGFRTSKVPSTDGGKKDPTEEARTTKSRKQNTNEDRPNDRQEGAQSEASETSAKRETSNAGVSTILPITTHAEEQCTGTAVLQAFCSSNTICGGDGEYWSH